MSHRGYVWDIFTALTFYTYLECKLDEVGPAEKIRVACYIAGLSQGDIGICFTPWRVVNIIIQVVFTFVHAK